MAMLFMDPELMELMQDFYVLTGIRVVLFDDGFNEITSYPSGEEIFCTCMRKNRSFEDKCIASDRHAFEECRRSRSLYLFKCHAGLREAAVPLIDGERIIGYMIFGQISDDKNREEFLKRMTELAADYGAEDGAYALIRKIKYRNERQLLAAAKLLEACTAYIRLKELVRPSGRQLIDLIDRFIEQHISEDISVDRICAELGLSRTGLYESVRPYVDGGIAAYVKSRRLEEAKRLIKTTELPIAEIAEAVGFSDYNYFLRCFKKKYGIPSKRLRGS